MTVTAPIIKVALKWFCKKNIANTTGAKQAIGTITPQTKLFILPFSLISVSKLAKNIINPSFATSDGWKLKPAILIHLLAPSVMTYQQI